MTTEYSNPNTSNLPNSADTNRFGPVQPGTHIDIINDLTDDERLELSIPTHESLVVRDSISVTYERLNFLSQSITNDNDALHDTRLESIESSPKDNNNCHVTVKVRHGDCFKFDTRSGTWMFVGTHRHDEQHLLFTPIDKEARNAPLYPSYCTMVRADFAAKLGGNRGYDITRLPPTTAPHPSEHALPSDESSTLLQKARTFVNKHIA